MPDRLRPRLIARPHPALTAHCPHCGAAPGKPCRLRTTGTPIPTPHASRQTDARLIATTVCPACQVEPGIPCRTDNNRPHPGIHHQRRTQPAA
ncbi:hypothetical protein ACFC26_15975 [Kitasatospora purpeofusca]|uniref:zinc finger domain-containing protein n=1 Tax=Kitasatospora purpeofusca TaxID=67352 RepID=UPI0035DEBFCA